MDFDKKTGDNGGVASGEAVKTRKDGKRKRKKGGASSSKSRGKDAAEEAATAKGEEALVRADSPPGLWATVAPSQAEVVVLVNTSDETSPVAQTAKKKKVAEERGGGSASSSWSEEDGARLRPFFVRTGGRKNSLVGKPLEEVREVVRLFKANLDGMADDLWAERAPDCPRCEETGSKVSTFYNMVSRMLAMLLHREQDWESRRTALEQRVVELEVERDVLREEKKSLVSQREERRREPAQLGVDAATSMEGAPETRVDVATSMEGAPETKVDVATSMESTRETGATTKPPLYGGVCPELLAAIDEIVARRISGLTREGGVQDDGAGVCGGERRMPIPPIPEEELTETWAQKVGRKPPKKRKKVGEAAIPSQAMGAKAKSSGQGKGPSDKPGKGMSKGRKRVSRRWPSLPTTAAVTLTIPSGGDGKGYAKVLASAREMVSLEDLEIPHLEVRRARTGAVILGVPGEDSAAKADRLAGRLVGVATALGVRVARPTRRLDLRISGLDFSVPAEELTAAIASAGGCREEDVRCRRANGSSFSGTVSAWAQCPMEAAVRLAKAGVVKVGWVRATVELLPTRPLRCYRCLELGHVRAQCSSTVVREHLCYRCGSEGHRGGDCVAVPNCPLCADKGGPAAHSLGGAGCVERATPPAPRTSRDDGCPP